MTNTRKNICSLTGFKHLNQTKKVYINISFACSSLNSSKIYITVVGCVVVVVRVSKKIFLGGRGNAIYLFFSSRGCKMCIFTSSGWWRSSLFQISHVMWRILMTMLRWLNVDEGRMLMRFRDRDIGWFRSRLRRHW